MAVLLGTEGADFKQGPNGESNTFILLGGDDIAIGGDRSDLMNGGSGSEILAGGAGNDNLLGSFGADLMEGDGGADIFTYFGVEESPAGAGQRDVIFLFEQGVDTIDLHHVDANAKVFGNQAFTFIGGQFFHGVAGELRVATDPSTGHVVANMDVNGDGAADMQIEVTGVSSLNAGDFIL